MMPEEDRADDQTVPAQAQEVIARQAQEIERLRRRIADERFAEDLREVFTLAATASTIAVPVQHSRLLEMIVETAAQVINARAASLFLIDQEAQELVFEVALGQKAAEVKKFRVPLGHGIAGLVAVTGQAMAVADAQHDPRHAADIAQAVDYVPQSILAVPLFYNDQVVGVLELLDKATAHSFSATDIEALGHFANQAAVAIEQSRIQGNLAALITEVLSSSARTSGDQQGWLQERARAFAAGIEENPEYRQALELALLLQEIVHQGPEERRACQVMLRGFADYVRTRSRPDAILGAVR